MGEDGVRGCNSSGCGRAGSLRLLFFFDGVVVESLWVFVAGWSLAGVGGSSVRAVPLANGGRSAVGCLRGEVRGGFVLESEAWAGPLIRAAIDCLF